jgi:C_GCAxxG_C_C family probable redox protein
MTSRSERAIANFSGGYNCAQSVLSAFVDDFGLDFNTAMAMARGFGGGVGHTGGICGTISGAVMVIGLATGVDVDNREAKERAYGKVQVFMGRFLEKHGSLRCSDLLGYDIGDPDEFSVIKGKHLFQTVCTRLIADAVETLEEMHVIPSRSEDR